MSDQSVHDLQGFFARIRLRDVEIVNVHAQRLGVHGVHGVLGVNESRDSAALLRFCDDVVSERGLPRARSSASEPVEITST